MKLCIVLIAFALFACSFASPVEQDHEGNLVLSRVRRVTCDLLSFSTKFGSLNHAACAANCLRLNKGFRGGRCRDGVCHCRR